MNVGIGNDAAYFLFWELESAQQRRRSLLMHFIGKHLVLHPEERSIKWKEVMVETREEKIRPGDDYLIT
jgi:hypothetical protein